MKRWLAIIMLSFFLSGCSGENAILEQVIACRQKLSGGNGCCFEGYITADYGDRLYSFVLSCQTDSSGAVAFSVIDPESISGISGVMDEEKGALTFDEHVLAFSMLADGYISPVSAPWLMIRSLRSGYIRGCGMEEDYIRVVIDDTYEGEPIQLDVWLDESQHPTQVDYLWHGRRIISMQVKNFQYL